jgi:hypothetical protein
MLLMENAEMSLPDPPDLELVEPLEKPGQELESEWAVPEIHFPEVVRGNLGLSRLPKELEHVNPLKEKSL